MIVGDEVVRFLVPGKPHTQGSKFAFVNKHTGKAQMLEQDERGLRAWRKEVGAAAKPVMAAARLGVLTGPLWMRCDVLLARPKSHDDWTWPLAKNAGDVDKFARAIMDALTGIVYEDDGQVVLLTTTKEYGHGDGCAVRVGRARR